MRPPVVDLGRGRWKHLDKRNKTIILWARGMKGPYALAVGVGSLPQIWKVANATK